MIEKFLLFFCGSSKNTWLVLLDESGDYLYKIEPRKLAP